MKAVSVSYAKNNLSALLRKVRGGVAITITDRGTPVAQLVPPAGASGLTTKLIELSERGLVRLPEREPSADWDKGLPPPPKPAKGASVVDVLLEERRNGR